MGLRREVGARCWRTSSVRCRHTHASHTHTGRTVGGRRGDAHLLLAILVVHLVLRGWLLLRQWLLVHLVLWRLLLLMGRHSARTRCRPRCVVGKLGGRVLHGGRRGRGGGGRRLHLSCSDGSRSAGDAARNVTQAPWVGAGVGLLIPDGDGHDWMALAGSGGACSPPDHVLVTPVGRLCGSASSQAPCGNVFGPFSRYP